MNIYYEINKGLADREFDGVTNFVQYDVVVRNNGEEVRYNRRAMECADRVWEESEKGVKYVKYRFNYPIPKIDMKEFMWVKLKSRQLLK